MNKYNLREYLHKELGPYQSSLYETSFDKENNEHLCSDKEASNVYDFDQYVAATCDPKKLPASPDTIFIGHKNLYFVEFKNQRANKIDSAEIKRKFSKGTEILQNLLNVFTPRDCKYHFCVVFRAEKAPKYFNPRPIEQNAVRFGLEEINIKYDRFYDQIITEDISFFKKEFKQLHCD